MNPSPTRQQVNCAAKQNSFSIAASARTIDTLWLKRRAVTRRGHESCISTTRREAKDKNETFYRPRDTEETSHRLGLLLDSCGSRALLCFSSTPPYSGYGFLLTPSSFVQSADCSTTDTADDGYRQCSRRQKMENEKLIDAVVFCTQAAIHSCIVVD